MYRFLTRNHKTRNLKFSSRFGEIIYFYTRSVERVESSRLMICDLLSSRMSRDSFTGLGNASQANESILPWESSTASTVPMSLFLGDVAPSQGARASVKDPLLQKDWSLLNGLNECEARPRSCLRRGPFVLTRALPGIQLDSRMSRV